MRRFIIIISLTTLILLVAKAYYDTNSIEVERYEIKNSSLGNTLEGLKVAHLSDLHIKNIDAKENKILEILKEEKPDLILITGDLISFEGPYEPVISFFHQLRPPLGAYAVLGNTEYSNENGSCTLCHEERSKSLKKKQNQIILRNSLIPLKINGKILYIIGVDDPVDKKSNLKTALKNMNSENPSILLAHSPEIFEEASGFGIDLLLCGHTHGGQIFLTKYLRKIFPLEASLEFLEGFFQKGKVLMYVNRGIGTSYLPFRLGVKPEITFFRFSTESSSPINSMDQIDQTNLSREMRSLFHRDPTNPSNSINPTDSTAAPQHSNTLIKPTNTVSISNNPPKTIFTGLTLSNLIETFNVLNIFNSLGLTATRPDSSTLNNPSNKTNPAAAPQHSNTAAQKILFDFESESDLNRLNWECHKWFELSEKNVTSGKQSLKAIFPPGQYPGIDFQEVPGNWSNHKFFKMDVFNPSEEEIKFNIRIDDNKSGWEYANRFDKNFDLRQGMNHISIPTDSIKTNIHHRLLNLKRIKRMMVFISNNPQRCELYIDNIRLE